MEEIIKSLKDLSLEIIQTQSANTKTWLDKTAKIYEQLLTIQYLEERNEALKNIEQQVKQNIEKIVDEAPINVEVPKPEISRKEETEEPIAPVNTINTQSEIREVPIPQGPPVPSPAPAEPEAPATPAKVEPVKEDPKVDEPIEVKPEVKEDLKVTSTETVEKEATFETSTSTATTIETEPKTVTKVETSTTKVSIAEKAASKPRQSLNDKLSAKALKFGLNDRIAFVKHLFNGSQEDYNRVVSQLNTFTQLDEAQNFIEHIVKPEYNWENKEEFSERFMQAVENRYA